MSSLNIALFAFRYPCSSVYLYSATTLSLCSSSYPLSMGNLIMSPTWQISLVVLFIIRCLGSSLCRAYCSRILLTVWFFHLIPITVISVILFLVSTFFCPVPSLSCGPLEDLLPSLSQYGSVSALPDDEDLEFDDSTSGFTLIIGEFLCFSCQLSSIGWQTVEFSPCSTSAYPYSHGLDCTGSLGFCMKTLVLHLRTKLRKTMFHFLYIQLPDLLKTHHCYLVALIHLCTYVVFTRILWCILIL